MSLVKFFVVFAIVAYAAAALGMYVFQRKLQYHPKNKGLTPASVGISGASVLFDCAPSRAVKSTSLCSLALSFWI